MHPPSMRIALSLAMLAAGCRKAPDAAQPSPLQFETKTFERSVPGCGDQTKREQPCVTFRVKWAEVIWAPNAAARANINATIRASLQPPPSTGGPGGLEAEAAALAEEFQRFHEEFPGSEITYFVRRSAEVIFSNAHLLSVELNEEDFKGGAHPNTHRDYLNLAPTTGESVDLSSLLIPDGPAKLTVLAERQFRSVKQIEAGKSLSEAGYSFSDDKFALSRTWGVTAAGLVIHYNDYEIAPHAAGPSTLLLPWSEIRGVIRKEAGLVPAH